jgi:hypothetical protein
LERECAFVEPPRPNHVAEGRTRVLLVQPRVVEGPLTDESVHVGFTP